MGNKSNIWPDIALLVLLRK